MKNKEELIAQAASLIKQGEKVLATETDDPRLKAMVNETKFHDFRISGLSFLTRVFGENSTHGIGFKSEVTQPTGSRTKIGLGIIEAAKRDLSGNWLETTRGSISRDILSDMLRLVKMEQETGHLRSAIIIGASLLEEQLRQLALANDIKVHNELQNKAVPKRGLQLVGELYKKKLISRQENKAIVGWLELANQSDSAGSSTPDEKSAKEMVAFISTFIAKLKY